MKRIDDVDSTQAIKLVMQDHRRIRRLLAHAEEALDALAQERAADLACRELLAHADIEERLLYPMIRPLDEGAVDNARYEHQVARQLIDVLDRLRPGDIQFVPTLRELGAWVDEHVHIEEEMLLAQARSEDVDLKPLADALLERQRSGAVTDVDVDAEPASAGGPERAAHYRQRERTPGRRGAH